MKIKTGEIAENKDKNVISSVQLAKGTRNGTLKLIVNGQIQDNVAVKGTGSSGTVIGGGDTAALWEAINKKVDISFFDSLFTVYDNTNLKITTNTYTQTPDNLEISVGTWTEEYLSALGKNSEGGGGGGGTGTVTSIQVAPNTYRDPDSNGIIDLSNDVVSSTDRTRWNNAATNSHTHSNKAVLDTITSAQVTSWNNIASIIGEDSDTVINKWNEVVAFLATYTEADTLANLLSNKLDVQFFSSIFTVYDSNGNAIVPNTYTQVVDNLKIMVGAWTEQYLSALGKNSEGGGGGTGDVSHIKISSNPDVYLDPVDGIIDMSSYAATWNAKANSATTLAGYGITDAKITNGTTITLGSNSITPLTANSSLAWSKLTGTPTTLAGYGIGDAKISNGVITLGSSTITPVTSVGLSAPTGFSVSGSPVTKTGTLTFAYASGYEGFTTSLKEKIEALYSWFEVDANGDVKTKDTAGGHIRGFYTESFVSALGANNQGGGSSTFDEEQMWAALQSTSGTYATTKIATSHIPDMASTYGYLKSSALSGYATQAWVNQQGFLTTHQTLYTLSIYGGTTKVLDFKPNANASIYIKAGGDISLANDTTNKYITLSYTHPTNGANTTISAASGKVLSAITVNSLGHVTSVSSKTLAAADIPDISATYATASRATTLEGYFTNGVAKTAAKLNTGTTTYTAWGQTYWSSGVPQSISGNMTSVGSITPSANGNALGTTSARFNIYGTAGNFSGNVSIGGTLGVTGATTLSSTLSVASGITLTTTKKIYFGDTSHYLELDSTGFHFSHGVYSDGFVSALGANSSGGGGGGIDIEAMWTELQGNTGTYANAKINVNHIPDISSTYGYAKQSWVNTQLGNYVTLNTAQTISGLKTMTHGLVVSGRVYSSGDDEGIIVKPAANGFAGITLGESSGIHTTLYLDSSKKAKWVYKSSDDGTNYSIFHPNKNGVIALTSDIPTSLDGIPDGSTRKLSNYLPLTGGTLTGTLTVPKIRINTRHSSGDTRGGIYYYNGTTDYLLIGQGSSNLWIGANETSGTHHTGGTYISAGTENVNISRLVNGSRLNYMVLDTGNYSSYALPLSGGTMTGILKWKDTNALPETTSPTYMLTIDSFANGGTTKWANLTNVTVGKATTASFLSYSNTNEINFKGGMQVNCWFNYRNADTNSEDGGTTAINYRFCNYTRATAYSTVTAGTFIGAFSGNATTATTLQTPRTIWGQSFDGSANVSGAMTGVADMTLNAGSRISKGGASNSILYIGDTNNTGWVCLQDMCSQTGAGDTYWSIRSGGNAVFKEVTATSDERRKNIISNTKFNVKDIASARSVLFEWKDDKSKKVHGGSIAQDWLGIADSFITEGDTGYYSLNYGALALCSAITIARDVVKHEDEITRLKKEVVKLRERVAELEERRIA